ncbi:MAG: hypothetical protein RLZZ399_548 [Verrucomicrobiota bacterium]|jgi:hypothetical protein
MRELFKKEVRALQPVALLVIACFFAGLLCEFLTDFPDVLRKSSDSSEEGLLVLLVLFASLTGANLVVGERADGTLRFLDSLPVSRTRVFFNKLVAGNLILLLVPVLSLGDDLFRHLVTHQSNSAPFDWTEVSLLFARTAHTSFYFLSIAVLLSFSGPWFALAVGFTLWAFFFFCSGRFPWAGLIDPLEFLSAKGFPWPHAATQLGVSTALLGLAWIAFLLLGDQNERTFERSHQTRLRPRLRILGFMLIPVVCAGMIFSLVKTLQKEGEKPQGLAAAESSFETEQTKRFDFVFRKSQGEHAKPLIKTADEVHDKVTAYLQAAPVPGRIVVDLGSNVAPHAAGQTNWTKIRIPLHKNRKLSELQAVLGHETTHVYIDRLSAGAMNRNFESARFFHEGLATFLEHKLFCTNEEKQKMRRFAAAAHSRGRVPFATLVSDSALKNERDGYLVYPLGEVFCEALVTAYGNSAPATLLNSFKRPNAPAKLHGVELWRTAMQACEFELERVTAEYDRILQRAAQEEAEFISKFPKITADVHITNESIVIRPQFEGAAPGKVACMRHTSLSFEILEAERDGAIRIARSKHTSPNLRYTLGWVSQELPWPLFEPWTEADLRTLEQPRR